MAGLLSGVHVQIPQDPDPLPPGQTIGRPDALSQRKDHQPRDMESTSLSRELNAHNFRPLLDHSNIYLSPVTVLATSPIVSELRSLYEADPDYELFVRQCGVVDGNFSKNRNGLLMSKGILYIPTSMQTRILEECHNSWQARHPGHAKMLSMVKRRYWWPGAWKAVFKHIDTCLQCQQTKAPRQKPMGYLMLLPVPKRA